MSEEKCSYRWLVLAACFIAIFIWAANYTAYSPLLATIKEELVLSYTESGLIATTFFVGYAVGQIPWGYFADRFGGKNAITLGLIGSALTSAMFGYSTSTIEVFLWRSLAGFLGAGIFVASVKTVSDCFTKDERALAIGIFTVGVNLGFLVAPPVSIAIEAQLGWRVSIYSLALSSLVTVPIVWLWLRRASESRKVRVRSTRSTAKVRKAVFWVLAYSHFVRLGLVFALLSWLPIFLIENLSFSILSAALALSAMNAVAIFSSPAGGLLSKRWGEIPVITLVFVAFTPVLYLLGVLSSVLLVWILVLMNGLLAYMYLGPMWSLSARASPPGRVGVFTGYFNTFASIGALTMPFLIGYLRDSTGSFVFGWLLLAVFCGLGAGATLLLRLRRS